MPLSNYEKLMPPNYIDKTKDYYNYIKSQLIICSIKSIYKGYSILRKPSYINEEVNYYIAFYKKFINVQGSFPTKKDGYGKYRINISDYKKDMCLTNNQNIELNLEESTDEYDIYLIVN